MWVVGGKAIVDMLAGSIHGGGIFVLLVLIDTLLDENLLEGAEEHLFEQLLTAYLQFLLQK